MPGTVKAACPLSSPIVRGVSRLAELATTTARCSLIAPVWAAPSPSRAR